MTKQMAAEFAAILAADGLRAFAFPNRLDLVTNAGEVEIVHAITGDVFNVRYKRHAAGREGWTCYNVPRGERTYETLLKLLRVSRPREVALATALAEITAALRETTPPPAHFVSATCAGERCRVCGIPATHKLAEEIPPDEPGEAVQFGNVDVKCGRHPLTAYVCCRHFATIVGPAAPCAGGGNG